MTPRTEKPGARKPKATAVAPKAARKASAPASKAQTQAPPTEAPPQKHVRAGATGKHQEAMEAAQRGQIPAAPDFSAPTHKAFRARLAQVVALVKAKDIAGLEAFDMQPTSSSRAAICRYRDLAITAMKARPSVDEAV